MNQHSEHSKDINLPEWVRPLLKQSLKRFEDESKMLHLSMEGLAKITLGPETIKFLVDSASPEEKDIDWHGRLASAEKAADWVQNEIHGGFPILHNHSTVALWSILEILCEDLVTLWLINQPGAWSYPKIDEVRISVGRYESLSTEEKARYVINELSKKSSINLRTGVGAFEPFLDIFNLTPAVGDNVKRCLHELSQIRNVIVHCGAKTDSKLLRECPWLPWKVGEPININHKIYGWYYRGANCYFERMFNQVLISFGNSGCTCPGMDDIDPRPNVNEEN